MEQTVVSRLTYLSVLLAQVDSITQAYPKMVGTRVAAIDTTQAYLKMAGTIGTTIATTIITQTIHNNYCIIKHQYVTIGHNHYHLLKNTPNMAKIQPTISKNSPTPVLIKNTTTKR